LYELNESQAAISAYDEAIKNYNYAINKNPKNENALREKSRVTFLRAETLNFLRRYDEAIEAYDQAIQSDAEASNYYDFTERSKEGKARAWYEKAKSLNASGEYEKAIAAYNTALSLNPSKIKDQQGEIETLISRIVEERNNTSSMNKDIEQVWYEIGNWHLQKGDDNSYNLKNEDNDLASEQAEISLEAYDKAARAFNETTTLNNSNEEAWFGKGDALSGKGRIFKYQGDYNQSLNSYKMAAEAFNESFKLNSLNNYALHKRGVALYWMAYNLYCLNKYERAIQAYGKAIQVNEQLQSSEEMDYEFNELVNYDKGDILYWTGRALESAGNLDDAASAYENSSIAFYKFGYFDEAIKAYDMNLKLNSSNAEALYGKGNLLKSKGEKYLKDSEYDPANDAYEEAIKSYDELLKLNSNDTKALYAKGDALLSEAIILDYLGKDDEFNGTFSEAISTINKSINLNPSLRSKLIDNYGSKADVLEELRKNNESEKLLEILKNQNSYEEEGEVFNKDLKMFEDKKKP
jgi:tetratricopeptide (TPR) repeat protein